MWWSAYRCAPSKYTTVSFPGEGRVWTLQVADKSKPIWEAVAQIMRSTPYLFREVAGGTYNCRPPSLHAYGLALDLNPSKNPFAFPLVHEYPPGFIERMEGIRANGKQAIMWGGRFPDDNPPDAMHWQINVAQADCKNVTWDTGEGDVEMWQYLNIDESLVRHAWNQGWLQPKTQATLDYFIGLIPELQKSVSANPDWLNFRRAVSNGIARTPAGGTPDLSGYSKVGHGHSGTVNVK